MLEKFLKKQIVYSIHHKRQISAENAAYKYVYEPENDYNEKFDIIRDADGMCRLQHSMFNKGKSNKGGM